MNFDTPSDLIPSGEGGRGQWAKPTTGVLPYQEIERMIADGQIKGAVPVDPSQIQPASLDLRLGPKAYRVRASFLPGQGGTVMEKIDQLDGRPELDLTNGAALERGCVYVIELLESLNLPHDVEALANPKSSTGRLDILTRLITDGGTAFDRIERGYKGKLYLEVVPLSFSVVVSQGSRLNQLRFQRGASALSAKEVRERHALGHFARVAEGDTLIPPRDTLVPFSIDLQGAGKGAIVGYKARKNARKIDVDRPRSYPVAEFWEPLMWDQGRLILEKDEFYILATREEVAVPPDLAAEMLPFDSQSGEFRVHYAGFFDPGFGWVEGKAQGSRAVLEVRSYGVPFTLEHGQIVGWLDYRRIANGQTDMVYGEAIKSNYQGQGIALAKHFIPESGG
ncbi:2'-deoxycytidine 5'-triphosphate deaminase [Thalassobaculum sp. OXR-137]|uniref:2'-deoxycytidine 5'-triphosphate deaminase n=1 Tax=Thalassobaculum sp. OXR-137 TaxID=3100173 RepID=UPI002AC99740|nr:2'-deoxycytidine 5'-triphosphate deaminase [Thalassobaculum sp. OXR-137]WPZ32995.1 2'-deoxycytidine 5'-triphosphate deaminase [Thalassobaculum sp. OXR-137]